MNTWSDFQHYLSLGYWKQSPRACQKLYDEFVRLWQEVGPPPPDCTGTDEFWTEVTGLTAAGEEVADRDVCAAWAWEDFHDAYQAKEWKEDAELRHQLLDRWIALQLAYGEAPFQIDDLDFWGEIFEDTTDLPSTTTTDTDGRVQHQQKGGFELRSGRRHSRSPSPKRMAIRELSLEEEEEESHPPVADNNEDLQSPSNKRPDFQDLPPSPPGSPQPGPSSRPDDFNPEAFFDISMVERRGVRKMNLRRVSAKVNFKDGIPNSHSVLSRAFDAVLDKVRETVGAEPEDRLALQIDHPCLDTPIFFPWTAAHKLNGEGIMARIAQIQQSKKALRVDSQLVVGATHFRMPRGAGHSVPRLPFTRFLEAGHGHCFVQIENKDQLCFSRAVAVAIDYEHRDTLEGRRNYEACKKGGVGTRNRQYRRARELLKRAGLGDYYGPCGPPGVESHVRGFAA